jgi:hypothetical protein
MTGITAIAKEHQHGCLPVGSKLHGMSISLQPALEAKLRQNAEAEGLSIEQYLERLMADVERADEELENLALEGLSSGQPIAVDSRYWEEKHRKLDQQLRKTGTR